MTTRAALSHRTTYSFDRSVIAAPHVLRLRPTNPPESVVRSYRLAVEPDEHVLHWQQDPFGNHVARVSFLAPIRELVVDVELTAVLTPRDPYSFLLDADAASYPFDYGAELAGDLRPYLEADPTGPVLAEFIAGLDRSGRPTTEVVVSVARAVASEVRHEVRHDAGVLSPEVSLSAGRGSCRDSAWLLVQLLRHLGLAARFVSGYLIEIDSEAEDTDLHAWAEVFLPGAGWVGIDPTSGLLTSEGHIPLAVAPHPRGTAPIDGTTEPCEVVMAHANAVRRIEEDA